MRQQAGKGLQSEAETMLGSFSGWLSNRYEDLSPVPGETQTTASVPKKTVSVHPRCLCLFCAQEFVRVTSNLRKATVYGKKLTIPDDADQFPRHADHSFRDDPDQLITIVGTAIVMARNVFSDSRQL